MFVPFDQARKNQRSNPAPRWSSANPEREPCSAQHRFSLQYFPVALATPKFQIGRDEKFFMIGSCFARGLEAALASRKCDVLSRSSVFDRWPVQSAGGTPAGATNKYNLGSIYNEFSWAFEERPFPEQAIVSLDNDRCYDPHMTPVFAPASREEVFLKRQAMTEVVRRAKEADVIVVTLGLTEVWKDTVVDLITNSTPNPLACRKAPERFLFGGLDYAANLRLLEDIYAQLEKHGKPGFRMVLTVSPVPLEATFTERDVVEATTYSKSLLRVVAEDFAATKLNVVYFPSYEIVMNSPRANAWMGDCRHVRGELANFIMARFLEHFLPDLEIAPTAKLVSEPYVG
jgi:hypothetical protein